MKLRTVLGVLAVSLGLATLVYHDLASSFDLHELLVTAVGLLAMVVGGHYALSRRRRSRSVVDVEPPEPRYRSAVPGSAVDAVLEGRGSPDGHGEVDVRNRLRTCVVEALVVREGYDREAARRAVEEGTWTDDAVAADYLAESRVPLRVSVPSLLRREPAFLTCVARTVTALEGVGEP